MENKRKPISKKIRFNIFDRDSYTCQYCGNTPPKSILEIDHIIPVSKGGTNDLENLRTSCFDCNRGKSAKTINKEVNESDVLRRLQETLEVINVAKEFNKAKKVRDKLRDSIGNLICDITGDKDYYKASVTTIIKALDEFKSADVMKWLDLSYSKTYRGNVYDEKNMIKYFCGILKNKKAEEM